LIPFRPEHNPLDVVQLIWL